LGTQDPTYQPQSIRLDFELAIYNAVARCGPPQLAADVFSTITTRSPSSSIKGRQIRWRSTWFLTDPREYYFMMGAIVFVPE
jgi:hypothetical protein